MYEQRNMYGVCEDVIPEVTDMKWLGRGDSVLIKVACNSGYPHPAVTAPGAVEAIVGFLLKEGAGTVYVGDQGGVEHVRLHREGRIGSTLELMRRNGLLQAVERSGGVACCFDDYGWGEYFQPELDFKNNWNRRLWVSEIVQEVDHIIYLPRLSAHVIAGYTCAIKNAVGFLRDDSRSYLHRQAVTFHEKIAEISHAKPIRERLRFCLTLADSALLNLGPDYGKKYDFDDCVAVASRNLVDHDYLASALLRWLDEQDRSVLDLLPRQPNLLNRLLAKAVWGLPTGFLVSHDCAGYKGRLQGYYPEKIAVHMQGNIPEGLVFHLEEFTGGFTGGIFDVQFGEGSVDEGCETEGASQVRDSTE